MPVSLDDFRQIFVTKSKLLSLTIFILLAILLEFVVHYTLKISYIYTHIFYLLILLAAIWYKRNVVFLALFLVSFISSSIIIMSALSPLNQFSGQ